MTFGKEGDVGGRESFGHFLKKTPTWMVVLKSSKKGSLLAARDEKRQINEFPFGWSRHWSVLAVDKYKLNSALSRYLNKVYENGGHN